ncbi:type II secretion system F family protein [Vibrio vulnificus]|uniref:type II secretion system F family protein n=1 Tax=Vibrio vulnificus TaxID=672 RepID=UPI001A1CD8ED|nr:type II secretion system F family protein [Vibrio vulnificus]EHV9834707.1 type II secretion system F family protein [Vibrio vulnificus]MCA3892354.1 type II secretion system F family protein [Vibrio vulnificus]MCA3954221.1 type II secretion system F family protein [Vibrio vulnificus]MCU8236365.1 type II secretion system F family protein [Vibrio vulnificus]HAS8529365.1 pilus assembly protein TadB [Vibrio vulnificus]
MKLLLVVSWLAFGFYFIVKKRKQEKTINRIIALEQDFDGIKGQRTVIDSQKFEVSLSAKIRRYSKTLLSILMPNPMKKIGLFLLVTAIALYFINDFVLQMNLCTLLMYAQPLLFVVFVIKLQQAKAAKFKEDFPDALNILSGALSSGQSIVHAFEYVGNQLKNEVGKQFKLMAERLLMGEDPDDVLSRSAASFPYVEYFFFAATIRINLSRGGQLKEVISRINRILFEARAIDKKKNALTSEARMSAKIIACLPVIFLLILKVTSPENYDFVMFDEAGKPIFYYVLFSEIVGFICIWFILRGVKS